MPWKKQISSGKWLLNNNNNNNNNDESLHNLISPNSNNNNASSSSNNDIDVLSSNMQMMSLSSPGTITNIIHGVKPSVIVADVADDNDSLRLDAETVTEESKGCETKNNEMRLIRRVSLSSNDSSSSISSSSNESTTAIITEALDDIICQIENKDLVTSYKVAYQIQQNTDKLQQLDQDGIEEDGIEEDSHNSGELTKSCDSADGSIDQECISSPSGNIQTSALNKFLSSPSPTNWENLVSSMKHRCQSPWGDGEFAVINVLDNGEEEGSVVVSDFDDSIEENKYAFISKYLKQQADASDVSGSIESSAVAQEEGIEDVELSTATNEEEPQRPNAQIGVEAAANNETVDSSPSIIDGEEERSYKKLTKRDTIYQSIFMYKSKLKSFTRQCRGRKKESYSKIPPIVVHSCGFSFTESIRKLHVPSSVTIIGMCAYEGCPNLTEVVLSQGIEEISYRAFSSCRALEHVNIPSTVKSVGEWSFLNTKISSIDLPDSINSIGEGCFTDCRHLTNVRIPSLVKHLPRRGFDSNSFLFSVEIPENVTHVDITCFDSCSSLRNIAFPSNAILTSGEDTTEDWAHTYDTFLFTHCRGLREVYDSMPAQFKLQPIRKAIMNRFDSLPIHELLYYQSYYPLETVLRRLDKAMNQKRRSRVLSATYQGLLGIDWLGMTPLHILACSKRQSLELYRVIIEKYPLNLITKDKFGAEPILYAIWGSAPTHILSFLAESYRSKHPDYELDWYGMIMTLSTARSTRVLHTLFDIQDTYFPDQKIIKWECLINEIASMASVSAEVFKFILQRVVSSRIDRIGLKRMTRIYDQIDAIPDHACSLDMRRDCLPRIRANLDIYEHDYEVLMEVVPVLELTVWKIKVDNEGASTSLSRRVCRYNCGADVVIGHILPFLLHEEL